jgi:hypothetical protein
MVSFDPFFELNPACYVADVLEKDFHTYLFSRLLSMCLIQIGNDNTIAVVNEPSDDRCSQFLSGTVDDSYITL